MKSVAGKRVLITGAAMGMGKIYAGLSVQENADTVILWDIDKKNLEKTAKELKTKNTDIQYQVVDVSSFTEIKNAVKKIGNIDILINNAGIVCGKYFWEHDPIRDIERIMAVNSLAPMFLTRFVLPSMIENKNREFRIVNVASAAGLVSNPHMSVYCASKWAMTGWSDSLRLELAQAGHNHIKVTTVNPTYISTGMFAGAKSMPFTPILTPEYVTSQVWTAMKKGKARLILPWSVYLSNALKGLLPIHVFDWMADHLFGIYHSMEKFEGRTNADK